MGMALLAYTGTPGVNASSFDLTALADPNFSQRNGHYIFTEGYRLYCAAHLEASAVRANFSVPTWNAIGKPNIYPSNVSATVPSPPRVDVRALYPPRVPLNEEFQFQATNNLGTGTEQAWGIIQLITDDFSKGIPRGQIPIMVRATASFTPSANVWSGPQTITFEQSLRGGVYAIVGAEVQQSGAIAFRIVFPRYRLYHGRKLYPGWLCQQSLGDLIYPQELGGPLEWGEWGRFHTFEPPQLDLLNSAASAVTPEIRLWLVYLGEDVSLLSQGLGGGPAGQGNPVGAGSGMVG